MSWFSSSSKSAGSHVIHIFNYNKYCYVVLQCGFYLFNLLSPAKRCRKYFRKLLVDTIVKEHNN